MDDSIQFTSEVKQEGKIFVIRTPNDKYIFQNRSLLGQYFDQKVSISSKSSKERQTYLFLGHY